MKQKVVFTLLMGLVTTGIVSFTLLGINRGVTPGFAWAWLKSWAIAYAVVVPTILLLSPLVQRVAQRVAGNLCRKRAYATHDA